MKILILLSHPAQFLFYRNPVQRLRDKGHTVHIVIKTKDVLTELLESSGWEYEVIHQRKRSNSYLSFFRNLLIRDYRIYRIARRIKPDLLMGTDASVAHVGKILGIDCVTTLEDDYPVIRNLARLTYPFTTCILTPEPCSVGSWQYKKVAYKGYMKLSYLHPSVFQPDKSRIALVEGEPYFLIRLSKLEAHHDVGEKGISDSLLDRILELFRNEGKVYISSEKPLPDRYRPYLLNIPPSDIHHYLYFSKMLICDSQSMAVEASMLGVPNIRVSSFKGKISVLEELEDVYKLTLGIQPEEQEMILNEIRNLLLQHDLKEIYQSRRQRMLEDKIDVTEFMVSFIENYPVNHKR